MHNPINLQSSSISRSNTNSIIFKLASNQNEFRNNNKIHDHFCGDHRSFFSPGNSRRLDEHLSPRRRRQPAPIQHQIPPARDARRRRPGDQGPPRPLPAQRRAGEQRLVRRALPEALSGGREEGDRFAERFERRGHGGHRLRAANRVAARRLRPDDGAALREEQRRGGAARGGDGEELVQDRGSWGGLQDCVLPERVQHVPSRVWGCWSVCGEGEEVAWLGRSTPVDCFQESQPLNLKLEFIFTYDILLGINTCSIYIGFA